MSPLVFLGVAAAVFAVIGLASWLIHRERRSTFEGSIETFRREMDALAPDWRRDQLDRY